MRRLADSGRAVRELSGSGLRKSDQLLDVFYWQRRMHKQDERRIRDERDRRKILDWIVWHLADDRGNRGVRACRAHHQRITIRRGACHQLAADDSRRARAVVDDEELAE